MNDVGLQGFTIGITAGRRHEEQARLFQRRGAEVVSGPTIQTVPLGADDGLRAATEDLIAAPPDALVANTGIGMREWFGAADSWGIGDALLDALRDTRVVARGPKAAAAVHQIGLVVAERAESERLEEVVDILCRSPLANQRVAFQRHGQDADDALVRLTDAGATVIEVPIYRWLTPDDPLPAERLVDAIVGRRVQAVTFTSAPAVHNLMEVAVGKQLGADVVDAFGDGVVAACVGSVCAEAATTYGVEALIPDRARLGPLVRAVAEHLVEHSTRRLNLGGRTAFLRGTTVFVDDETVVVTPRESALLAALADADGSIVTKRQLLGTVWGDPNGDQHVVETTVGRLRSRLGPAGTALVSVPRRGYRLSSDGPRLAE